jgi:non-specific serine/threonine protein kinase
MVLQAADGTGPALDIKAKEAYRNRLRDLEEELQEAEAWRDPERAARARYEIDFLTRELAGAVGLGGRDRTTGSDAERARVNVTRSVKAALARIRQLSPALGAHLDRTVRTGNFCSYNPDPRLPVSWQL